ncbi:hypothetical protein [Robertmurraya siralis]|uniref:hypothetical protein n=1 Tax=Robertmurraya siralis TaxID=77777 RepID=UPI0010F5C9D6|nr:hypothetical protein [Robertmurraya siralis]
MKIKINAVSWKLLKYMNVLSKYNFTGNGEQGTIEIISLEELFNLTEDLGHSLIINKDSDEFKVTIFDDYL